MPDGSDWPFQSPSIETQHKRAETHDGKLHTTRQDGGAGVGGSIVAALAGSLGASLTVSTPRRGSINTVDLDPPE
jgi:hypothetical protein